MIVEIRKIVSDETLDNESMVEILTKTDVLKLVSAVLSSKTANRLYKLECLWILINFSYGNDRVIQIILNQGILSFIYLIIED
jgi:hypothetical protein